MALHFASVVPAPAQEVSNLRQDTVYQNKVLNLLEESEAYLNAKEYQRAALRAQRALDISQKKNYAFGEAESVNKLADINRKEENFSESVRYSLWAVRAYERIGDQPNRVQKYLEIGYLYYGLGAYTKAIDYFLTYQKAREKLIGKTDLPTEVIEAVSRCYVHLHEYNEAQRYYNILLKRYQATADTPALVETYQTLAFIAKEKLNYQTAVGYTEALLTIYLQQEDVAEMAHTYNNLGFLYKRLGNLKGALEYFSKAVDLSQSPLLSLSENSQVSLFTNLGIAYTNLSLFTRAREYYLRALKIRERQKNPVGEANIHNHLASNYFVGGKNAQALKSVITAIEIGVTNDAGEVLATSYQILSKIYEADNNLNKAQLYAEKYNEIKDRLENMEVAKFEKMLDQQLAIEKREDEIKAQLVEQERKALEVERKVNELELLKRDQELQTIALQNQQLEKDKATQALTLARQQLQAEKRNQKLKDLERQKQVQDLQLRQQSLEKQQQERAIALLEADKKLKDQKLKEEATLRKYGYGIIGLFLLIMAITAYSFAQKQKDNRKLHKQQEEIQEKNEQLLLGEKELRANMNQLQLTQEVLAEQKQQLEMEHRKTQESIHYAQRIQFSILPTDEQRASIVPESFVIYRPKDIVSGDFYWISQSEEKKITSVVDCTGHGVPGSLVSLIGNNLLNEAINEHQLFNPAEILDYLDVKVRAKLKQDEGTNRDGMDLGLCVLEEVDDAFQLTYGGAKNTLFVVTMGELITLKGDRKSIGGLKKDFSFTQQQITLQKGDTIYLTTDGFIDQANHQRERFGSRRLRELIGEVHTLPMNEQYQRFEVALDEHQGTTEQRDDINLIGIRV